MTEARERALSILNAKHYERLLIDAVSAVFKEPITLHAMFLMTNANIFDKGVEIAIVIDEGNLLLAFEPEKISQSTGLNLKIFFARAEAIHWLAG